MDYEEELLNEWHRDMFEYKQRITTKVHVNLQSKADVVTNQFFTMFEQASYESVDNFQNLGILQGTLQEAMQGLTKLTTITILKENAGKVMHEKSVEAVVNMAQQRKTLEKRIKKLKKDHAKEYLDALAHKNEMELYKKQAELAQEVIKKKNENLEKERAAMKTKIDEQASL